MLKSDRFGMEMLQLLGHSYQQILLKSDRFGMERIHLHQPSKEYSFLTSSQYNVKIRPFRYGKGGTFEITANWDALKSDRFGMESNEIVCLFNCIHRPWLKSDHFGMESMLLISSYRCLLAR